jgi:hypothetical protein
VSLGEKSGPVGLTANPFDLENLIWQCLDFATQAAGEAKQLVLRAETTGDGVRIRIQGLAGLTDGSAAFFPGWDERILLSSLGGGLKKVDQEKEMIINFFKNEQEDGV